jgi:uncharacterized protein YdeI (YjbR/CyaY-like superfamily)
MPLTDPRVDAYIEKSQPFARPILKHLRRLVHEACPEMNETIKWGFPNFEYKGLVCSMASFKAHCAFNFWKASLMKDASKFIPATGKPAMGHFSRITSIADLPSDNRFIEYVREAVSLNEAKVTVPKKRRPATETESIPESFSTALKENPVALSNFEKMPPGHKREYIQWINEAKTEATRMKRINTSVEWISEGKGRNWKYERP